MSEKLVWWGDGAGAGRAPPGLLGAWALVRDGILRNPPPPQPPAFFPLRSLARSLSPVRWVSLSPPVFFGVSERDKRVATAGLGRPLPNAGF